MVKYHELTKFDFMPDIKSPIPVLYGDKEKYQKKQCA